MILKKILRNVFVLVSLVSTPLLAQNKLHVYLFPGQGSDYRIFDSLIWDNNVDTTIISYGTPAEGMSMKAFAETLIPRIDTTEQFALVGVSLGGMICAELSELIEPKLTIIISSAKNSRELPMRYNFQKVLPIYSIFPCFLLTTGARLMQPVLEPATRKNKTTFKSMLKQKKPLYMKRTVEMIIKWDRTNNYNKIYQIHGNKDHTIPIRNLQKPYYVISSGSHMMTLTQANEVSGLLKKIILEHNI